MVLSLAMNLLYVTLVVQVCMLVICSGTNKDGPKDSAFDGIQVRSEKVVCQPNPKYCSIIKCSVKSLSRKIALVNVVAFLKSALPFASVRLSLLYQFSNNEYRPVLMDVKVNYCAEDPGKSAVIILNYLRRVWQNNTNIFRDAQSCPIQPGEYYLKDWNFSASKLPDILPAGRYKVIWEVREELDELILKASLHIDVAYHGILDMRMG